MSRRTRRRLYVVGLAALLGAGSPAWGPPLLRSLPAFQVERVEVTGCRYVAPDEVVRRADLPPDASVWDDPTEWARRVREHPMVRGVTVQRSGWNALEFAVEEVEPAALVPTSTLRPVDASGRLLPLDPAEHALDLPVISAPVRVEGGAARGEAVERLLGVLRRLRGYDPGFVARVSELRVMEDGSVEVRLVEGSPVRQVLLPAGRPVEALRRVELALGEHRGRVRTADARFRGQVVLDRAGGAT